MAFISHERGASAECVVCNLPPAGDLSLQNSPRNGMISTGNGNLPSTGTSLLESATTTIFFDAVAMIFSRNSAPRRPDQPQQRVDFICAVNVMSILDARQGRERDANSAGSSAVATDVGCR